jgi:gamma-glutamyltranspeptidase/glutathione hydrolase
VWDHEVRSPEWVHLITESAKLAFADREAWYGDPRASDVPLAALLSRDYAAQRSQLLSDQASFEVRPGAPAGRSPRLAATPDGVIGTRDGASGEPTVGRLGATRGDTCHVDVVDRWGNMVSATPSGGWLQSSPVIAELGFPLGTRAQMFDLQAGLPNSLRAGMRPRTTLSPSLAMRDGEPWLAFGTPGGDQQDQWQTALLLTLVQSDLRHQVDLQAGIDAPTFHTGHVRSSFYPREIELGRLFVESRLEPETIGDLRARGHDVEVVDPWQLGRLTVVARSEGWLSAGADPRGGQCYAVGR